MHTPSLEIASSQTSYFFSRGRAAAIRRAKDGERERGSAMGRLLVGAARPGVNIGSGHGGVCTRKPRHRDRAESSLRN